MLGEIFDRFVKESPVTVMTRGLLERLLNPGQLDAWFERTAEKQYTRELLFSTVVDLLMQVVCGVRKSVHVAYQAVEHEMEVSVQSVYNKLNGLEPNISAELVRFSAQEATGLIEELGAERAQLLPGYRVKMLDGNCLEASEHRLKELRVLSGGALPGKSLVVYDPAVALAVEVFPCEDGHAQERSLLPAVLKRVGAGEAWVADRNFCVRWFLLGIAAREAFFVVREHEQLPWTPLDAMREVGQTETGAVAEQAIAVIDEDGNAHTWRRIRVRLNQPTRDGDRTIYILTNLPVTVDACTVADLYRKRWTIETAFQEVEKNFESEINTLGYPRAALFGFCLALVAYNTLAVIKAALRHVHGQEQVDHEVSGYYLAEELGTTYRGMMIAIPPPEWQLFQELSPPRLAELLVELAQQIRLSAFRKHRRGPKKPRSKPKYDPKRPHVSTAKLIAARGAR
jgi:IS4 transposase